MLSANRIQSRNLRRFWSGDGSKVNAEWRSKVARILSALNVAVAPEELNIPGYRWHPLKGDLKGTYAVSVSANWRITYKWDQEGPFDVNLEDYHGS
jgi:proteic killer suppression protein